MSSPCMPWMREARLQLRLAIAVAVTMLAQFAVSTTTTLIIARLGVPQLAGAALAMSVFLLFFLATLGVVTGITPIVADAYGRGDLQEVRLSGQQGLWLGLSIPGTVALVALSFTLTLMVGPGAEADAMEAYLVGAALGLPTSTTYVAVRCLAIATGRVAVTTTIMMASVGLHAGLAWWLVFGGMGVPPLGVLGAGLAYTLTGVGTLCLLALILCISPLDAFAGVFRPPFVWDGFRCRAVLRLGIPFSARIVLGESVYPVAAFALAPFGASAVAAHAVALRVFELAGALSFGFNEAAVVRVSQELGARSSRAAAHAAWCALWLSTGASVMVGTTVLIGRRDVAAWMLAGNGAGDITTAAALLPFAACLLVADAVQSAAGGVLTGLRDARRPLFIAVAGTWAVGLPTGLLLARVLSVPVDGMWCGLIVGNLLVACAYVHRSRRLLAVVPAAAQPSV